MKLHKIILIGLCLFVSSCSQAEQKEVKAKDLLKVLQKGKSIEVANLIILDDLDFTTLENEQMLSSSQLQEVVSQNVYFYNCIFMGKVTTSGTKSISSAQVQKQMKFEQNFVFQNCDFRGDVNFDNTIVQGQFSLQKSKFRQSTSCNNMMIWGKDTYLSEIEAEQPFHMIYCTFLGNVYLNDATFLEKVSMQESTIHGKFVANNVKAAKAVAFDMLSVRGRALFNYAEMKDFALFSGARFFDDAEFIKPDFGAQSLDTIFKGAHFYGKNINEDVERNCCHINKN